MRRKHKLYLPQFFMSIQPLQPNSCPFRSQTGYIFDSSLNVSIEGKKALPLNSSVWYTLWPNLNLSSYIQLKSNVYRFGLLRTERKCETSLLSALRYFPNYSLQKSQGAVFLYMATYLIEQPPSGVLPITYRDIIIEGNEYLKCLHSLYLCFVQIKFFSC